MLKALLLTFFIIFGSACGPTEVTVEVDEVNVDTEFNNSMQMPNYTQSEIATENLRATIVIPTPVGLEAISEAVGGLSTLSEELQKTVGGFSDVIQSLNTPTPSVKTETANAGKTIGLNELLLSGFIVTEETTSSWTYEGLERSYKGYFQLDNLQSFLEVLIFVDSISDPSFASSIAVDFFRKDNREISITKNIVFACASKEVCESLTRLIWVG